MTNPLHFCYASVANVVSWAEPSALFVTGPGNRHAPEFQQARAQGAEVFAYFNVLARPDDLDGHQDADIMAGAPLWPNDRSNWPNTKLIDMRDAGWRAKVAAKLETLIVSGLFDGVFCDTLGSRLWSADWSNWPTDEQRAWTASALAMAQLLDTVRRRVDDSFKIVHNSLWNDDARGEQYCDGVCIENHAPTVLKAGKVVPSWHTGYVTRPFGDLNQRRVLIIARNDAEAAVWATAAGVTHVASVDKSAGESYAKATPAIVKPVDIRVPELRARVERLRQQLAAVGDDSALVNELTASRETSRLLGDRVDLLTTKIKTMAAFVAEQAEGVE